MKNTNQLPYSFSIGDKVEAKNEWETDKIGEIVDRKTTYEGIYIYKVKFKYYTAEVEEYKLGPHNE